VGGGAEAGEGGEVVAAEPARRTAEGGCPHVNPNMKKTASRRGASAMGGKVAPNTVDEYLADIPEPAQSTLKRTRAVIRSVVPAETTEVISYGIPMFKYRGMLVGYAAFKGHCSLFPTGSGVIEKFAKELEGFPTSRGTIRFPSDKPLPDGLVKKIVKTRVAENKEWD
jgi:uncharacterized protein YdhG (YjbR/CyaY superfamily)